MSSTTPSQVEQPRGRLLHFSTSSPHSNRIYSRALTPCVCVYVWVYRSTELLCIVSWSWPRVKGRRRWSGNRRGVGYGASELQNRGELPQIPAAPAWLQAAGKCQAFPAFLEDFQPEDGRRRWIVRKPPKIMSGPIYKLISRVRQCWVISYLYSAQHFSYSWRNKDRIMNVNLPRLKSSWMDGTSYRST